jgi:uncharacterized protein
VLFDWDSAKNGRKIRAHGIGFADAVRMFPGLTWERLDDRVDYGEERWVAIGLMDGTEVTAVYTDRVIDNVTIRRMISARRATSDEREAYYRSF